jgi:predicted transcriptional regulator
MTANLQYEPNKLETKELKNLSYILENKKAKSIISVLFDRQKLYLNQIQNLVGGSKTSTIQILKLLQNLNLITSNWEFERFSEGIDTKVRAVRAFRIQENQIRFLEFYKPLIEQDRKGLVFEAEVNK